MRVETQRDNEPSRTNQEQTFKKVMDGTRTANAAGKGKASKQLSALGLKGAMAPAIARPTARPQSLGSDLAKAREEGEATKTDRERASHIAEGRFERRADIEAKATNQADVRKETLAANPEPQPSGSNGPSSPAGGAAQGRSEAARPNTAATVAALVEKIQAFNKAGIPTLQVSFTSGMKNLANVQLKKTASGEVTVSLSATGNASRSQLSEHARTLKRRLNEEGLRVAALIIA